MSGSPIIHTNARVGSVSRRSSIFGIEQPKTGGPPLRARGPDYRTPLKSEVPR
jgi:hypothetical protein